MTTTHTTLEARIEELAAAMKLAKRALRKAQEAEAEAKRILALRTIDVREARQEVERVQGLVHKLLDITPPNRGARAVVGWNEVWCPHCHHTFVPSCPGGNDQ